jgi:hypothetical protein
VKKGSFLQGIALGSLLLLIFFCLGYGRHSKEEVYRIGKDDLKAINDIIGNNKFLFGEKVCNVDATVFGMLVQYLYHCGGPLTEFIKSKNILNLAF